MAKHILICLLPFIFLGAHSQSFTDLGAIGFPAFKNVSAEWGDYDADNDLDVLVTGTVGGTNVTSIYMNLWPDFAEDPTNVFPGLSNSYATWGDYDNDGYLDLLLTGRTSGGPRISTVYRSNYGLFSDILAGLVGVESGCGDWGDYDNDGDLDILLTGSSAGTGPISKVYRNNSGTFTDIAAGLVGVAYSACAWGDYDSDGDLDIVLAGASAGGDTTIIYNNDSGVFTDISAGLPSVFSGTADWGDFDNDGDLDLLMTGILGSGRITRIFRNTAGSFAEFPAGLSAVSSGSGTWGDYDNDGDLDILITGQEGGVGMVSKVYRNDGTLFSDISAPLLGVWQGCGVWGDCDNDNDLDFFMSGIGLSGNITRIYRNDDTTSYDTCPSPPASLIASPAGSSSVRFNWSRATDDQTPDLGLSYRLWIGSAIDSFNIASPWADTATGIRHVAAIGNLQDTSWTLKGAVMGETYFACVSAIDAGFKGSPCSEKISFMLVGMEEGESGLTVLAGPNPTSDFIKVSIPNSPNEKLAYQLTTISGQTLAPYSGLFEGELTLHLSNLPSGMYHLQLSSAFLTANESLLIIKE